MKFPLLKIKVYLALGLRSIARVAIYRLGLKTGLHPVLKISSEPVDGPFYTVPDLGEAQRTVADRLSISLRWFDWFAQPLPDGQAAPDWFTNPFSGREGARADRPWWQISDFDNGGDIKSIWELSRLGWLLSLAGRAADGDHAALQSMNRWLADWSQHNPPYLGSNWKCGQEASIRVMHLLAAALITNQDKAPEVGLLSLIDQHLKRIAPTLSYAIGQDNNHGTSEAAALFIAGHWLEHHGQPSARKWGEKGRKWLEDRAQHLIEADGTFSQYSVVYQRVMLDSYALAELWRQRYGLQKFSDQFYNKLRSATRWLQQFTDPQHGDAPNIGANDGARLLPITDSDYRDFRPSLQLAGALFCHRRMIEAPGLWDQHCRYLGVEIPTELAEAVVSQSFDQGGFHILRKSQAAAYLRYPRFRFRPGQCDALHMDFWLDGINWLRDAGSYSYNSLAEDMAYFNGVAAHNSVQFDGRDQMPRIGRFLLGEWLAAQKVELVRNADGFVAAAAGYCDWQRACHDREVRLYDHRLEVIDRLSGSAQRATLRWRLRPGNWRLTDNIVAHDNVRLSVESPDSALKFKLSSGEESLFYLQKTEIPVMEIVSCVPAKIITRNRILNMHILYFHQHFSTPQGSAGIRSYKMARTLIEHGHKVTMICGSFGPGKTGLAQSFASGVRRGNVDGIEVVEFGPVLFE